MPTTREVNLLKEQLAAQERENERLRSVIKLLTSSSKDFKADEGEEEYVMACSDGGNEVPAESGSESDDASSDKEEVLEAYWDENDSVYRCAECNGEVLESVCAFCGKENYVSDPVDSLPTDNQTMSDERQMRPRSTTPLLDIPVPGFIVPLNYRGREWEYYQLLRRGATRVMCEQFNLGFTEAEGIVASANDYLYEEFSSDEMEEGDSWKIYLGRRIELDEEDVDGTDFIEGLLEDGALFAPDASKWTTVKEGPKLWVTRPNMKIYKDEADSDDEGGDFIEEDEDEKGDEENDNEDEDEGAAEVEASPIENEYDIDEDDDEEDESYYTETSAEETDSDEGTVDLNLYEVGISMGTHGGDVDWQGDESDTGASYEQEFETAA